MVWCGCCRFPGLGKVSVTLVTDSLLEFGVELSVCRIDVVSVGTLHSGVDPRQVVDGS